jgi:hypothetical protein
MNTTVFLAVVPCSLIDLFRSLGLPPSLHLRGRALSYFSNGDNNFTYSQEPATGLYPEQGNPVCTITFNFLEIILIQLSRLLQGLPSGLFLWLPIETLINHRIIERKRIKCNLKVDACDDHEVSEHDVSSLP